MEVGRRQEYYFFGWVVVFVIGAIAPINYAKAQVVPDATLPLNPVGINGNNFTITGGTQAGGNLFHSFSEFSLPTNASVFFNNALTVQNIINRVTHILHLQYKRGKRI